MPYMDPMGYIGTNIKMYTINSKQIQYSYKYHMYRLSRSNLSLNVKKHI